MAYKNYFSKFYNIEYKNQVAKNILSRVQLTKYAQDLGAIFYPYTIQEGEKAEAIAESYYGDPRYDWVIYMVNNISDPYYDWPLDTDKFYSFINQKYGSVEKSQRKVLYYKNNWTDDDTFLSIAQYEALTTELKKYWIANKGYGTSITGYSRKPIDKFLETNKTVRLTVADSSIFASGDIVDQIESGTIVGSAEVKYVDSTGLIIQKVIGEFTSGSGTIVEYDSKASTTISDVETLHTSISNTVAVYWSTVFAFDYEFDSNESKRHIQLLDSGYLDQVEEEFKSII